MLRINLLEHKSIKKASKKRRQKRSIPVSQFDYGHVSDDQFIEFAGIFRSKEWYSPKMCGLGPGELPVAMMLLGIDTAGITPAQAFEILRENNVFGCKKRSFDIIVPQSIESCNSGMIFPNKRFVGCWEVKEPDSGSEIRSGVTGTAAMSANYSVFVAAAIELRRFARAAFIDRSCGAFQSIMTDLRAAAGSDTNKLVAFITDDFLLSDDRSISNSVGAILAGNLTQGRATGNFVVPGLEQLPEHAQGFGLYQVIDILSRVRAGVLLESSMIDDILLKYQNRCPTSEVLDALGLSPLQWFIVSTLRHKAFFDPNIVVDAYIQMADPLCVFSNVNGLVLVNPNGFKILRREKLSDRTEIRFKRVAQARPKFWVKKFDVTFPASPS